LHPARSRVKLHSSFQRAACTEAKWAWRSITGVNSFSAVATGEMTKVLPGRPRQHYATVLVFMLSSRHSAGSLCRGFSLVAPQPVGAALASVRSKTRNVRQRTLRYRVFSRGNRPRRERAARVGWKDVWKLCWATTKRLAMRQQSGQTF